MRKGLLLAAAAAWLFALSGSLADAAEEKEFKGQITDDMCGGKHMMENVTAKQCADECVKMGAKYALFVPDGEKVYALDAQNQAKPLAGESVIVKGTLGEDGKSIHVTSIRKQGS